MNPDRKNTLLQGVTDGLRLFPFSLAVGVCSGFGITGGMVAALVCVVCGAVFGMAFLPSWWMLLPVFLLAYRYGAGAASVAVLLGGVLSFLLSLVPQNRRENFFSAPVWSGFMLAAAFSTTALQTTNYFGIGAVGGTVTEIIRDYVSLGFHPNWRGVMYGTIVMVVLITYPRKFKKLCKKLPSVFVSLLLVLPMHLLLVPHAEGSPLDEIGSLSFGNLFSGIFFPGDISKTAVPLILCSALSLALLMSKDLSDRAMRSLSVPSMVSGVLGGVPVCTDGTARTWLSAVVSAAVTALLYLCPGLSRMPVHAVAVILIVIAWQDVRWGSIADSFKGGIKSVVLFVASVVLTVFLGVHYAVPLLVTLSVLLSNTKQKERS